jgi:UDP-glucose:(heptosyl)LPS alpha-1,3-glucosyltransferase
MYRRCERKKRLLFVGKEWKRKGLDRAVEIIQALRATDSGYTLTVMGVDPTEVPSRWRRLDGVIWVGWKPSVPYADYDILVHPARQEPFGMVVLEARAAGLGCVITDVVGAGECDLQVIAMLPGDAAISEWVRATQALIDQPISYQASQSWDDVATYYLQQVYPLVRLNITGTSMPFIGIGRDP